VPNQTLTAKAIIEIGKVRHNSPRAEWLTVEIFEWPVDRNPRPGTLESTGVRREKEIGRIKFALPGNNTHKKPAVF